MALDAIDKCVKSIKIMRCRLFGSNFAVNSTLTTEWIVLKSRWVSYTQKHILRIAVTRWTVHDCDEIRRNFSRVAACPPRFSIRVTAIKRRTDLMTSIAMNRIASVDALRLVSIEPCRVRFSAEVSSFRVLRSKMKFNFWDKNLSFHNNNAEAERNAFERIGRSKPVVALLWLMRSSRFGCTWHMLCAAVITTTTTETIRTIRWKRGAEASGHCDAWDESKAAATAKTKLLNAPFNTTIKPRFT